MNKAIGGVELSSLARGFDVTDSMLKTASVELLLSRSICPGKYVALISGDVAEVTASVEAGTRRAGPALVDSFVIPNVHEDVFPALYGSLSTTELKALGIIETFSVSCLIEAADAAAKAASVKLIEIRLAMALGGKAFVTFTGEVAAVETAVKAGAEVAGRKGLLTDAVTIPQPRPELLREMI